jgi:CRP-like cAMP-binding protein
VRRAAQAETALTQALSPAPASVLDRGVLFGTLSAEDRAELAARGHRRTYAAGEPVFHTGDPGDSLMAILSGIVRISLPTANGREIILADLPAGELFGEIAVLDGLGRSADATAHVASELLVIERAEALGFLAQHPDACLKLLAVVCGKWRASDERMSDIASFELPPRLAKAILKRARPEVARPHHPALVLSQGEIARMVGATREAVNRQLSAWQRNGIVELRDGAIIVIHGHELAVIAGMV